MNISGRDKVYVAALPFRATTEPFQSATSALHALHLWDLQHFIVIIKTSSPPSNSKAWFVFINFQISDTYLMDMGLDINLLGHLMAMFTHNFCWNLMIFCLEQVDFLQHVCIDFLVLFTNVLGISFSFSN